MSVDKVQKLTLIGLIVSIITILAGAVVSATGSGNGCGASWPKCNGSFIPEVTAAPTLIEFSHRAISGILLIITLTLFFISRRYLSTELYKKNITLLTFFVVLEAVIGMVIVLFELVANDASFPRVIAVPIHLVNTFSLLAFYLISYCVLKFQPDGFSFYLGKRFILTCVLFFLVGMTGSITALADALYPSENFLQGFYMDLDSSSSVLTRIRILHPMTAVILLFWILFQTRDFKTLKIKEFNYLKGIAISISLIGILNVFLNINIVLSILHLFLADILWLIYIYANIKSEINIGSKER